MGGASRFTKYHEQIETLYFAGVSQEVIATVLGGTRIGITNYIHTRGLKEKKDRHQVALVNAVAAEIRAAKHGLARTEGKGERE